jgi:hypothetical protein
MVRPAASTVCKITLLNALAPLSDKGVIRGLGGIEYTGNESDSTDFIIEMGS